MSGKGRTQDRGVCSLLSPRSCVSPLRLAPPLHAGSVAKVPPARPQFDKYRLVLLFANPFFCLFPNTASIVISAAHLPGYDNAPNQQHQRQYQHSTALLDRFSRSHAVIGSCFFSHRGFVRHITPATPPAAHLHAKKHLSQRRQRSLSSHPNGSPQPARL